MPHKRALTSSGLRIIACILPASIAVCRGSGPEVGIKRDSQQRAATGGVVPMSRVFTRSAAW
jgi:hypothetical protein